MPTPHSAMGPVLETEVYCCLDTAREVEVLMAENILEKADAQVAESIHKLSRATSAMAEAIDDGVDVIKRAVKRSSDAAEELVDDYDSADKAPPRRSNRDDVRAGCHRRRVH